jgi:hypothetical protein
LDRNEYNHITATYFLLAERKLRAQRQTISKKLLGLEDKSHPESLADDPMLMRGRTGSNPSSPTKKLKDGTQDDSSSIV